MDGLTSRVTDDGVPVLRVHYSSDPAKRPGTPDGDAWLKHALVGVVGGMESARWRREMEIDYGALGGTLVFPRFAQDKKRLCVPPFEPVGMRLYGAYDHGWRHRAAFLVIGQDRDGRAVPVWQFTASGVGVKDIARLIKGERVRTLDGRVFEGNPYAKLLGRIVADPSIWKEDQNQDDGTTKSVAELFRRHGVHFQPGQRGGDTMVCSWLTDLWSDLEHPGCMIQCPPALLDMTDAQVNRGYAGLGAPVLVWELQRLRFRDWSETQMQHHDPKEEIEDKNNDNFDAFKMHLHEFPPKAPKVVAPASAGTVNWFRKQRQRIRQGLPVRTFSASA